MVWNIFKYQIKGHNSYRGEKFDWNVKNINIDKDQHDPKKSLLFSSCTWMNRYDNVTLSPLLLQRGLWIDPIQRNGGN
jgi:hypothetical protein